MTARLSQDGKQQRPPIAVLAMSGQHCKGQDLRLVCNNPGQHKSNRSAGAIDNESQPAGVLQLQSNRVKSPTFTGRECIGVDGSQHAGMGECRPDHVGSVVRG